MQDLALKADLAALRFLVALVKRPWAGRKFNVNQRASRAAMKMEVSGPTGPIGARPVMRLGGTGRTVHRASSAFRTGLMWGRRSTSLPPGQNPASGTMVRR